MKKIIIFLFIIFLCANTYSQVKAEKVELMELVGDLFITKKTDNNIKQVWWLPIEYWNIALNDSKYSNQAIQEEINRILKDYVIFVVTNVDINLYGAFKSKEVEIALMGIDNKVYKPLERDDINKEVFSLLDILKPTIINMLGQLGEHMNFYVFKNLDEKDNLIAGPLQKGQIAIDVNNVDFTFRLPLSSMVEKKSCPVNNELLNGNWEYCPWHGKKLIEKTK